MTNVNLGRERSLAGNINATLKSLLNIEGAKTGVPIVRGEEDYVNRIIDLPISLDLQAVGLWPLLHKDRRYLRKTEIWSAASVRSCHNRCPLQDQPLQPHPDL